MDGHVWLRSLADPWSKRSGGPESGSTHSPADNVNKSLCCVFEGKHLLHSCNRQLSEMMFSKDGTRKRAEAVFTAGKDPPVRYRPTQRLVKLQSVIKNVYFVFTQKDKVFSCGISELI